MIGGQALWTFWPPTLPGARAFAKAFLFLPAYPMRDRIYGASTSRLKKDSLAEIGCATTGRTQGPQKWCRVLLLGAANIP